MAKIAGRFRCPRVKRGFRRLRPEAKAALAGRGRRGLEARG